MSITVETNYYINMKTRIFNLIILDESGSMQSIKQAAINGMNETIQSINEAQKKHEEQEHVVTLVTFNSSAVKTIYDCVSAQSVKELDDNDYCPNCCTPLYDAMGQSLNTLRPKVGSEDKVLVTIITDGEENSSTEYNGKAIKALVDELKSKGWVFAYIGANQDVEKVAATISVTNVMNFTASDDGTSLMMGKWSKARNAMFDRIADGVFCAESENLDFFSTDDD